MVKFVLAAMLLSIPAACTRDAYIIMYCIINDNTRNKCN